MKCACFRKTLDQALLNHDPLIIEKQKTRNTLSHIIKSTGYQRKRLLNPVSSGVYECNSKCSCHPKHCSNRLVQQGLFVQLQLFKDKDKGWGLRPLHDLPRGTFICQYLGELLTSDQGHERAQTMDDKYQTSLDLVKQIRYEITHDEDDIDEDDDDDDDDEPYVIDGSLYSNLGKYFNHSCDPNMYIQNVFIESHDLHFPNLALFTRTHIKAGQGNISIRVYICHLVVFSLNKVSNIMKDFFFFFRTHLAL
jgi:SET domain-containing protein